MRIRLCLLLVLLVFPFCQAFSQLGKYNTETNLNQEKTEKQSTVYYIYEYSLENKTSIKVSIPKDYTKVNSALEHSLEDLYNNFTKHFGAIPKFELTIFLMEEADFFKTTGAPSWTNALYYKDEILVPVNQELLKQPKQIARTVKHEFSHAIINALSAGNCPGWLDEGLAQWVEGHEHKSLSKALGVWLEDEKPISLAKLQGGFTSLETEMVAPAYAQSLYASRLLLKVVGKDGFKKYFKFLRDKESQAFHKAFGFNQDRFQNLLKDTLAKKYSS